MNQDRVESERKTAGSPDLCDQSECAALADEALSQMHKANGSTTEGLRLKQAGQKENSILAFVDQAGPKKYQPPTIKEMLQMMEDGYCTVDPSLVKKFSAKQKDGSASPTDETSKDNKSEHKEENGRFDGLMRDAAMGTALMAGLFAKRALEPAIQREREKSLREMLDDVKYADNLRAEFARTGPVTQDIEKQIYEQTVRRRAEIRKEEQQKRR